MMGATLDGILRPENSNNNLIKWREFYLVGSRRRGPQSPAPRIGAELVRIRDPDGIEALVPTDCL
jgi:hypothetical protein